MTPAAEYSEQEFQPELKLPASRGGVGELAEVRIADGQRRAGCAGRQERRCVRQIESLCPLLKVEQLGSGMQNGPSDALD